jgi:hypothetical protein
VAVRAGGFAIARVRREPLHLCAGCVHAVGPPTSRAGGGLRRSAGSGRARLDDQVVELSAWDVLRVAPAVIRSFEASPEGLDMICIGGRKPKGGDTERFEDFWN